MEIEKKYLVKGTPEGGFAAYRKLYLEQGYLHKSPVIRIRRIQDEQGDTYILTIKGKGLTVREEWEMILSKEEYESMLPKVEDGLIRKNRYLIPLTEGLMAEVDEFLNPSLQPLVVAEVEFPSVETMERFEAPDWFGEDVSGDPSYQNNTLSLRLKKGELS